MRDVLHSLPVQQRIHYRITSIVWHCVLGNAPSYLLDLFILTSACSGGCLRWHDPIFGTLSVQSLILGPTWNGEDASFDCAQADRLRITGIEDPATCPGHKQSLWDKPLLLKALSSFRERLHDPYD